MPWWIWVLVGVAVLGGLALLGYVLFKPGKESCPGPGVEEPPLAVAAVDPDRADSLARRFAPVFVFTNGEGYRPIPRPAYVRLSDLYTFDGRRSTLDQTFDGVFDHLPQTACTPGCKYFLKIKGVKERNARAFLRLESTLEGTTPIVYYHVVGYTEPGQQAPTQFAIEYWLFYLYNSLKGDLHEGDLEQVTIRVGSDGRPSQALFSTHVGGIVRNWADVERQDDRAVSYVAVSSHANYFATGLHGILTQCRKNLRTAKACLVLKGLAAHDWTDGCGALSAWRGDTSAGPSLSRASCEEHHQPIGPSVRYTLAEWTPGFPGSWGPPKILFLPKKQINWLDDPTLRTRLWSDPLAELRAKACYEGSAA